MGGGGGGLDGAADVEHLPHKTFPVYAAFGIQTWFDRMAVQARSVVSARHEFAPESNAHSNLLAVFNHNVCVAAEQGRQQARMADPILNKQQSAGSGQL